MESLAGDKFWGRQWAFVGPSVVIVAILKEWSCQNGSLSVQVNNPAWGVLDLPGQKRLINSTVFHNGGFLKKFF